MNKDISNGMKIVFFGTPSFIDPVFETLRKNFDVVEIIQKPQEWNDNAIEKLKSYNSDLLVVAAYGKILPAKILEIPKYGAINIHPSLLPKYRGPSPIQTAILNGDKTTGVSIIKMDEQMDHGPILSQIESDIFPSDTFESLAKRLFQESADILVNVIKNLDADHKEKIQDESKATYTKLITKQDGFLGLKTLEIGNRKLDIERAAQAYFPWPGVWTKFDLSGIDQEKIIKLLPDHKVQVEGKNPMSYADFINGYERGKEFLGKINLG